MIKFAFVLDSAHFVRVGISIIFDVLYNSIVGPRTFPQPSIMLACFAKGSRDEEPSIKHTYIILANTHPPERNEDHDQWVHPDQWL